jgi:hypothetical protein
MNNQSELVREWRLIEGYEDYSVSNTGQVWSIKSKRYLSQCNRKGYLSVKLTHKNKGKSFSSHKLVAEAFLGKKPEGCIINHKDFNKQNNNASNLEFITQKENIRHAVRGGVHITGSRVAHSKLTDEKVLVIKELIAKGIPNTVIGKRFGVTKSAISDIKRGWTWKHLLH